MNAFNGIEYFNSVLTSIKFASSECQMSTRIAKKKIQRARYSFIPERVANEILLFKMSKPLFGEDSASDAEVDFGTNKEYAKHYNKYRQKELLKKRKCKRNAVRIRPT